ncbi:MAG: hypothetical protein KatS3mg015_2803 [Fimbriimonadales bacterium]|nr:MAG: hypothetical protein KatS3mg015_2803 [Fimbriimonadales bacterium]
MPVITTGIVDTEAVLADEKVVDMEDRFRLLDPDTSQFQTILNKLPSKVATREKVNWLEDELFPNLTTLAASATNAQTAISVAAGTGPYFRVGDLVRIVSTGEMVEVTGVTGDSVGVTRGIGGVGATSAASGGDLLIVANASAQGADYGTLKVTKRVLGYNYTQIVRHPFGFTGTDVEIETYGPGEPMNETAKKAIEHKRALENLSFFGARAFTSASPSSKGYMGGLSEFIQTNVWSSAGNVDLAYIDSKLQTVFQHGSLNKVIFAAPTPAAALSTLFAKNWVRARPEDRVYGAKVSAFVNGAYGESVPVIVKREWGARQVANNGHGSWLFIVDLDYVKKRPMRNRNTKLLRNRQGNGEDKVIHEYLTECSLEVSQEKVHGLIKGITGASA